MTPGQPDFKKEARRFLYVLGPRRTIYRGSDVEIAVTRAGYPRTFSEQWLPLGNARYTIRVRYALLCGGVK